MSDADARKRTRHRSRMAHHSRAGDAAGGPGAATRATGPRDATTDPTGELPLEASAEALRLVESFAAGLPFPLDPFQREAAVHLADGRSVLVAAPTGTGKTVVAECAIWLARRAGQRAIYTAPLKALSNQKFRDLRAQYGAEQVGLMTGDIVENPTASIVVMTTEIYRNMLLEGSRALRRAASVDHDAAPDGQGDQGTRPAAPADGEHDAAGGRTGALQRGAGERPPRDQQSARTAPATADALLAPGSAAGTLASGRVDTGVPPTDAGAFARQAALDEELSSVGCVIFDELHYLSDRERGPVWEEAIIHSPAHVTFVGLSATVSNADELCDWMRSVHGPTALVFHVKRAVPLEHYFFLDGQLHLVQNARGERVERFPGVGGEAKLARERNRARTFVFESSDEPTAGRRGETGAYGSRAGSAGQVQRAAGRGADGSAMPATEPAAEGAPVRRQAPEPGETLTALRAAGLLPCLYFLPGRRAVEGAAANAAGHLLVSPEERARLHDEVQEWVRALPPEDQRLDQVRQLAALLPRGLAFHHAGLLPGLKVMVETLFGRGALRAVFATDTLALGINMPARSVVLGSMSKFDGISMRLLTPNEYQQLTGRAGRRGMDAKGAAVIPYSPWDEFEPAFALLTGPVQPVISAFSIRYNTVLNLWRAGDLARLRAAVSASLREYQRRRAGLDEVDGRGRKLSRRARLRQEETGLSRFAAAELNATIRILRGLHYIGEDDQLTIRGHLLRALFHPAGMVLTELLLTGVLDDLGPAELAEAVSWFTFDDDRSLRNLNTLTRRQLEVRREVYRVLRVVQAFEYNEDVAMSPGIADTFYGVALNWWRGSSLSTLVRRVDLAEGDLLVSLNQTIDLLQQLQGAVGQALDTRSLWDENAHRGDGMSLRTVREIRSSLASLRPALDAAWRGLLRGSVAQSRAVPSMTAPLPPADGTAGAVPLAMAEDEDPAGAAQDRTESLRGPEVDADRSTE